MDSFLYDPFPGRVLFGAGMLKEVKNEVVRLGAQRALVLSTPNPRPLVLEIGSLLGEHSVGIYEEAVMHVHSEVVSSAVQYASDLEVDLLVAAGGGSTIGLAKGMALETGLPILAVPTTYAGSEMTHIWGITKDGQKSTGRDVVVKPKTVLYDPVLFLTLPPAVSAMSGMNAMAHALEALYASDANPVTTMIAESSIRDLATGLPAVIRSPGDVEARSKTLRGAWLASMALGTVGMALHHKLCHVLGGTFNLPHAAVHTVILPYAIAYNASHAPEAMEAAGRALEVDPENVAGTLYDLNQLLQTPLSLEELGMTPGQLEEAASLAVQRPYYNPRPVTKAGVVTLLMSAYQGKRP